MNEKPDYLTDPRVFELNREESRSIFKAEGEYCEDIDLSGNWNFRYFSTPEEVPAGFQHMDASFFSSTIEVPGEIQMQGFGSPHYVNTQYPWDGHEELLPPRIPERYNPVGLYYKQVEISDFKKAFISFYGVETAFDLFVNGSFIGYAEDSFTRSEFDITKHLKKGRNIIIARVFRFSSASWLEDQDFWRFSGIFRPVVITLKKRDEYLVDIDAKTHLSEDLSTGELTMEISSTAPFISAEFNGEKRTEKTTEGKAVFLFKITNPPLWSAEKPNLVEYRISALDASGEEI